MHHSHQFLTDLRSGPDDSLGGFWVRPTKNRPRDIRDCCRVPSASAGARLRPLRGDGIFGSRQRPAVALRRTHPRLRGRPLGLLVSRWAALPRGRSPAARALCRLLRRLLLRRFRFRFAQTGSRLFQEGTRGAAKIRAPHPV